MKKLKGVVVPVITPLTEDDQVDVASLKRLCEHCIEGGLPCLYPCGTTGEMLLFSVEERKRITETVVQQAAGRAVVYAQVGAMSEKDTIELAQHAVACGCDGIGVVTPSYFSLSDKALVDFYCAVAHSVPEDFPVYLYAIPQNAVNDLNEKVAQEIADKCKNVIGIKYSAPNMTKLQKFMLINNETFSVFVGPDHLFEAVVAVGGGGTVSGNAMILREHYAALWNALEKKDFDLATKLQRRTNVLNGILGKINNISAYKVVLKHEGIIATSKMRAPMGALSPDQEKELLSALMANQYKTVLI